MRRVSRVRVMEMKDCMVLIVEGMGECLFLDFELELRLK